MPNIRSQSVSKDGITIVSSDGRSFSVTRAQVIARFGAETGNRAQRRTKTLAWMKTAIEAALGSDQVRLADIRELDFDDLDVARAMVLTVGEG